MSLFGDERFCSEDAARAGRIAEGVPASRTAGAGGIYSRIGGRG